MTDPRPAAVLVLSGGQLVSAGPLSARVGTIVSHCVCLCVDVCVCVGGRALTLTHVYWLRSSEAARVLQAAAAAAVIAVTAAAAKLFDDMIS